MEDKELEILFKEAAKSGKEPIAGHMWERLDLKLSHSEQASKLKSYKYLSRVAAAVTALFIAGYYIQNTKDYNPNLIAYAPGAGLIMEDLTSDQNEFYSLEKLESLSDAYRKLEMNNIK